MLHHALFPLASKVIFFFLSFETTDRLTNPSTPLTSQRTHRIRLTANQPVRIDCYSKVVKEI